MTNLDTLTGAIFTKKENGRKWMFVMGGATYEQAKRFVMHNAGYVYMWSTTITVEQCVDILSGDRLKGLVNVTVNDGSVNLEIPFVPEVV